MLSPTSPPPSLLVSFLFMKSLHIFFGVWPPVRPPLVASLSIWRSIWVGDAFNRAAVIGRAIAISIFGVGPDIGTFVSERDLPGSSRRRAAAAQERPRRRQRLPSAQHAAQAAGEPLPRVADGAGPPEAPRRTDHARYDDETRIPSV